jgi:lipid-binding SYLF domain-containing protein
MDGGYCEAFRKTEGAPSPGEDTYGKDSATSSSVKNKSTISSVTQANELIAKVSLSDSSATNFTSSKVNKAPGETSVHRTILEPIMVNPASKEAIIEVVQR